MTDTPSPSTGPSKDTISMLARQLWEQEGRPAARDTEFWLRAEKELLAAWEFKSEPPKLTVAPALVSPPLSESKAVRTALRRTSAKPVKRAAR